MKKIIEILKRFKDKKMYLRAKKEGRNEALKEVNEIITSLYSDAKDTNGMDRTRYFEGLFGNRALTQLQKKLKTNLK